MLECWLCFIPVYCHWECLNFTGVNELMRNPRHRISRTLHARYLYVSGLTSDVGTPAVFTHGHRTWWECDQKQLGSGNLTLIFGLYLITYYWHWYWKHVHVNGQHSNSWLWWSRPAWGGQMARSLINSDIQHATVLKLSVSFLYVCTNLVEFTFLKLDGRLCKRCCKYPDKNLTVMNTTTASTYWLTWLLIFTSIPSIRTHINCATEIGLAI